MEDPVTKKTREEITYQRSEQAIDSVAGVSHKTAFKTKDEMLKPCNWQGNLDLLNIVLIGITNDIPEHD